MSFLNHLMSFNRKERFILLDHALKDRPFRLSGEFSQDLSRELGLRIPANAFVAMDFHLDWIAAALNLIELENPVRNKGIVKGNQQDVDLLIAFTRNEVTTLILIEAKAQMSWSNAQLSAKTQRISEFLPRATQPDVKPYFVLTSPTRPMKIKTAEWPNWMKKTDGAPHWVELPMSDGLIKPTICSRDGKPDIDGNFVKLQQ